MTEKIEEFDRTISESRQAQLDLERRRLSVEHSVSMHRERKQRDMEWPMADNRTNEQLAERLRLFAESEAMDFGNPHIAKTLEEIADRLTGTITEVRVDAAAKLEKVREYAEATASNDMSGWDLMAKLVGDGAIHCARGILAILDGEQE